MYKMIIVDDNTRELEGIARILEWDRLGIEVVGLCCDGQEAIDYVDKSTPDIILTDIEMPIMNGIKMSQILKETHPNIKIVFMSCYNDFDFAQSAIELDIYGYVLKPIIEGQLEKAIRKVLEIYEVEKTQDDERKEILKKIEETVPLMREQFLRELVLGVYSDVNEVSSKMKFLGILPVSDFFTQVITIHINVPQKSAADADVSNEYYALYTIRNIIDHCGSDEIYIYTFQNSNLEFISIVFNTSMLKDEVSASNLDFITSLKDNINFHCGINVTIGVSNVSNDIMEIPILKKQAVKASNSQFYDAVNQIVLYEDIQEVPDNIFEVNINLQTLYMEIKSIISSGNPKEIVDFLSGYFDGKYSVTKSPVYIKSFTFSVINTLQIVLIEFNESFDNVIGDEMKVWRKLNNFDTIQDVRIWLHNILNACIEQIYQRGSTAHGHLCTMIKAYIDENYSQHLSVNDIAKHINFSSSRANTIFKEQMGKTIFDYLSEYRIKKAKELLKAPDSKVYIVMEQVGYFNRANFNLQFQKYTGMTPLEYKNSSTMK